MSAETDSFTGWAFAGASSAVATLFATLTTFAYKIIGDYREEIKDLKKHAQECEAKHFDLNGKYSAIEQELCFLRDQVKKIDKNGTQYSHQNGGDK